MSNINNRNNEDQGVSPVIGVILMVAITVILSAVIGVFVLDLAGNTSQPAQASVTLDGNQSDGLTIRLIDNQNTDSISIRVNGTEQTTLNTVGDSTTIALSSGDKVTVVGINNGNETVLRTYTAEQTLGNVAPADVSGTVSYNPPAEGVTVKALDDSGNVVGQDTTDVNGNFSVPETGNYTVNGYTVSATVSEGTDIELDSSDVSTSDGVVEILMDTDASGSYQVDSASDLQAMERNTSANYKLVSNIDATHTSNWNKKTSHTYSNTYPSGDISAGSSKQFDVPYTIGTVTSVTDGSGDGTNLTYTVDDASEGLITVTNNRSTSTDGIIIKYDLNSVIYKGFKPIGSFNGSLNGNNHTVSNMYINRSTVNTVGMIKTLDGSVSNINVTNADITGNINVGVIVGNVGTGSVSNSYANGSVSGYNRIGVLVGYINSGSVSESHSTGSVNASINGGGLVGKINGSGSVSNSYSTASITVNTGSGGGLVGSNYDGSISKSYATGSVTGSSSDVGALVGENGSGGSVTDSYWESSTMGDATTGIGTDNTTSSSAGTTSNNTGLTTSEMQGSSAETNMSALDFSSIWTTVSGEYPNLQWE